MKSETKIYSNFIKRNKIVVRPDFFVYNIMTRPEIIQLVKFNGKWYADDDPGCLTKKGAIYHYLTNRLNVVNGIIQLA